MTSDIAGQRPAEAAGPKTWPNSGHCQAVPFHCNISVPESVLPTAQARPDCGMTATPCRWFTWPGWGVMTCFQLCPFQCRARVPVSEPPTAQTLSADDALTPARNLSEKARCVFGLRAHVHLRPFQCRITALPEPVDPTAQAFLAEVAATPLSR